MAVKLDRNVDQPRNLAKSVTVSKTKTQTPWAKRLQTGQARPLQVALLPSSGFIKVHRSQTFDRQTGFERCTGGPVAQSEMAQAQGEATNSSLTAGKISASVGIESTQCSPEAHMANSHPLSRRLNKLPGQLRAPNQKGGRPGDPPNLRAILLQHRRNARRQHPLWCTQRSAFQSSTTPGPLRRSRGILPLA